MFKELSFGKITSRDDNYIIDGDSIEERKEKLNKTISTIQLAYADARYRKEKNKEKKFSLVLDEINCYLIHRLRKIESVEREVEGIIEEGEREKYTPYCQAVDKIYTSQCLKNEDKDLDDTVKRLAPIQDYIYSLEKESFKKYPEVWQANDEADKNSEEALDKLGLFNCRVMTNSYGNPSIEKLKKEKFSEEDKVMDIIIPDVFATGQKFSKESIKESLRLTANLIIDKYPEVAAVVGHSWLFSLPVAQKIAPFHIVEGESFPNWSQLVDKDGNIHKERFKEFVASGELPYKSIFAYLSTEEFVRNFSDRHGEIELKKLNPVWLEKDMANKDELKKEEGLFKELWSNKEIKDKVEINLFFDKMPLIKERLVKAGIYKDLIDILEKNIGVSVREINLKNKEIMESLREKLKQSLESGKYISYKIIL